MLIDINSEHANWREVLRVWNRIANWQHYKTSKSQFEFEIKTLLIYLLSEKDWLKHHYASKKKKI